MGRFINHFCVLIKKNVIVMFHHKIITLLECFFPILIFFLLNVTNIRETEKRIERKFIPFLAEETKDFLTRYKNIAYSPSNPNIDTIMSRVAGTLDKEAISLKNAKQLQNYIDKHLNLLFAAVQFDDKLQGSTPLPKQITFKLRFPTDFRGPHKSTYFGWHISEIYPESKFLGPRFHLSNVPEDPPYYDEGFLALQYTLSHETIIFFQNMTELDVAMERFPTPEWTHVSSGVPQKLMLAFIVCFLFNNMSLLVSIIREQQRGMKHRLLILGTSRKAIYLSWYLRGLVCYVITIPLIVLFLKVNVYPTNVPILPYTSPVILLLLMLLVASCKISFCFLASTICRTERGGVAFILVFCLLLFIPCSEIVDDFMDEKPLLELLFYTLFYNAATGVAVNIITTYENFEEGSQWSNFLQPYAINSKLHLGHVFLMLGINFISQLFLAMVFDKYLSVSNVRKFKFYLKVFFGYAKPIKIQSSGYDPEYFEPEQLDVTVGIKLRQVHKVYLRTMETGLKDFSLSVNHGQITVLLGHNASGKSTVLSTIMKLYPMTSGSIEYYGESLEKHYKRDFGFCSQTNNQLYLELTPNQHLYFYCNRRGIPSQIIEQEINYYFEALNFQLHAHTKVGELSRGLKRKLCVCIALCGGTKIVCLDEPTADVDTVSRRDIWNLLLKEKYGRTIFVTTRSLQEADILGDKIGIISKGRLTCCGSSMFLKEKLGTSYHLRILRKSYKDIDELTKYIRTYIPGVEIEMNTGRHIVYMIHKDYKRPFGEFIKDLEQNANEMGIESFSISSPGIKDYFLAPSKKIGEDSKISILSEIADKEALTGMALAKNQCYAMFLKRFYYCWTRLKTTLFMLLFVPIMLPFSMQRSVFGNIMDKATELNITITSYKDPIFILTGVSNYKHNYVRLLETYNLRYIDLGDNDLETFINFDSISRKRKQIIFEHYLVGCSFDYRYPTILYFNNNQYHSAPLSLNIYMNVVMKTVMDDQDARINVINAPITARHKPTLPQILPTSLILSYLTSLSFPYFVTFYAHERVRNVKVVQFTAGVNVFIFWFTNFLFDFAFMLLSLFLLIIVLATSAIGGLSSAYEISGFSMLYISFCFGMLMFTYAFSLLPFPSSAITFTCYSLVYLLNCIFEYSNSEFSNTGEEGENDYRILHYFLEVLPMFQYFNALSVINNNYIRLRECSEGIKNCKIEGHEEEYCKKYVCLKSYDCCDLESFNFYSMEKGILKHIYSLILIGVSYFAIVLIVDYKLMKRFILFIVNLSTRNLKVEHDDMSEDTVVEYEKVRSLTEKQLKTYKLAVKNLTKVYGRKVTVDRICMTLKDNECFGLLGMNASGKTTVFRMLTGETLPSYGDIWINGYNCRRQLIKVYRSFGYCPQKDAFIDKFTVGYILTMYCMMKGYVINDARRYAHRICKEYGFAHKINENIERVSFGIRRKLHILLSLIGYPTFVIMDQPTNCIDDIIKRSLFKCLHRAQERGVSIILTTYDMYECEILCNKVGIMINGKFESVDEIENLKAKLGMRYAIYLKLRKTNNVSADIEQLMDRIYKFFPIVVLSEQTGRVLSIIIADTKIIWTRIFNALEVLVKEELIEDYTFSRTTLDLVFEEIVIQQQKHLVTLV